jgi:hypothetical protein
VFWFLLQLLSETFLIIRTERERWSKTCSGLHAKYPLFLSDMNDTWTFTTVFFKKPSNTKFYEKPSSESRVFPCEQTDGRTDMTKIIIALRNFANAPNDCLRIHASQITIQRNTGIPSLTSSNDSVYPFHRKYMRFPPIFLNCPPSSRDLLHNIYCVKFLHKVRPIVQVQNMWRHILHHWHFS